MTSRSIFKRKCENVTQTKQSITWLTHSKEPQMIWIESHNAMSPANDKMHEQKYIRQWPRTGEQPSLGAQPNQPRFYVLRSLLFLFIPSKQKKKTKNKKKQKCKKYCILFSFTRHKRSDRQQNQRNVSSNSNSTAPQPPKWSFSWSTTNNQPVRHTKRAAVFSFFQKNNSSFHSTYVALALHCLAAFRWNHLQQCCIPLIESALNEM